MRKSLYRHEHLALDQHAIVSATDSHGKIIYVNDKFCESSGYSRDELLGRNHRLLKSGIHPPRFYQTLWNTVTSGEIWHGEMCNRRKDGSLYWVESTITPFANRHGGARQYLAIRTDITRIKDAESRLRRQAWLQHLLAEAAALLLDTSAEQLDGNIRHILARCGQFLDADRGYLFLCTDNGAGLSNAHEWCAPGISARRGDARQLTVDPAAWWWQQASRRSPTIVPNLDALPSGAGQEKALLQRRQVRGFFAHPLQKDGEPIGFLGFEQVRDVDFWPVEEIQPFAMLADALASTLARQHAEQALIAAREQADRASRAKSEFLSGMSHELRTPMNAILGFGQLLEDDPGLDGEQRDNVHEILGAGRHLLELINEVLDLARVESGRTGMSLEPQEVRATVSDCLGLVTALASDKGIAITCDINPGDAVLADRTRFKQVLLNLLSNAIKYNHTGGSVDISARGSGDNRLRILVTDTGPGIPDDRRHELFQPFNRLGAEQSGIEGTGIGLTITERLLEMMDGHIGVDSQPGRGSTFWIDLPGARLEQPDPERTMPAHNAPRNHNPAHSPLVRVLYIEDNPANLRLLARLLSRHQCADLITASQPRQGLDLAREHRPDLILADINMPDLDGYQLLQLLRSDPELSHTPVAAVTANAMPADIRRGLAAGFDDYLTKPVDKVRLFTLVDRVIARKTPL